MTDDEARDRFKRVRWSANDGEPFCPHCGCLAVYALAETPPRWKCSGCRRKFSLTSQALFHSRKLLVRDYLAVIALFVNGVKGTSALQISRDININPTSAFVLLHKLREAMGSQIHNPDNLELSGEVQRFANRSGQSSNGFIGKTRSRTSAPGAGASGSSTKSEKNKSLPKKLANEVANHAAEDNSSNDPYGFQTGKHPSH